MKNLSIAATAPTGLPDSVRSDIATSETPQHRRTVGNTEQRLRAKNKKAWLESTKGWSDFFGRFTTFAKPKTS